MQSIPLAVLKPFQNRLRDREIILHAIHTACGIETIVIIDSFFKWLTNCMQSIPLAVLKQLNLFMVHPENTLLHAIHTACGIETCTHELSRTRHFHCMQSIPLAVLKQKERVLRLSPFVVSAFLCNIYKKAAQVSDDACAAFCISLTMFPSP